MRGSGDTPKDWRYWLGTAGAFVLGVVLLVAAWAKALDPGSFAELIHTEGLDIVFSAKTWALVMIVAEVALGLALVLNLRRWWVLILAAAMVTLFVFLNARTYWQFSQGLLDESSSCGCFGNLVERTPSEAFWQDLAMLVPPLLLSFLGRPTRIAFERLRIALVAVVSLASAWFVWKAPELPLDDLATRLKPGVEIGEFCAGRDTEDTVRICLDTLMPELQVGRHIVVMATLDNEELRAGVDALSEAAVSGGPSIWLLTDSLEEERQAFYWEWAPAFEIREVPLALIRPLYRRQPRSFELESGRVPRTFSGLPPAGWSE
jgi:uncharacterized membrane protein YphA (DoxX/SURF4 family)